VTRIVCVDFPIRPYHFCMSRSLEELRGKASRYRALGLIALFIGGLSLFIGSSQTRKECYGACSVQDWFNADGNPNNVWVTVQEGGVAIAIGWILIALGVWAVTLSIHFNSLIKSSSSIIEGLAGPDQQERQEFDTKQGGYCKECGSPGVGAFCSSCGSAR